MLNNRNNLKLHTELYCNFAALIQVMKKAVLVLVSLFLLGGPLFSQKEIGEIKIPIDSFLLVANTLSHDFGTIDQNTKAQFAFEITNTDDKPLVIWSVSTSCGCTTPTWTKKPVKKGETAKVKVKYDSSRLGHFEKSVFVYTNFSDQPIQFFISGTVNTDNSTNQKTESGVTKTEVDFNPTLKK